MHQKEAEWFFTAVPFIAAVSRRPKECGNTTSDRSLYIVPT